MPHTVFDRLWWLRWFSRGDIIWSYPPSTVLPPVYLRFQQRNRIPACAVPLCELSTHTQQRLLLYQAITVCNLMSPKYFYCWLFQVHSEHSLWPCQEAAQVTVTEEKVLAFLGYERDKIERTKKCDCLFYMNLSMKHSSYKPAIYSPELKTAGGLCKTHTKSNHFPTDIPNHDTSPLLPVFISEMF